MALPFERLLTALNSRQFPVFSRPPAQLLNLALRFRVSRRLSISLAEYQKQLAKQQQLEAQKEQEQLLKKPQQQQAAEGAAGQQDGHAGQMGSGNGKTQEHMKAGQGHAEKEPSSGKPSAAQPMENGHATLANMQPRDGSTSGVLANGPQSQEGSSTQQLNGASTRNHGSPIPEAQPSEPSQARLHGDDSSEVRQDASGAAQEMWQHSTEASQANGRHRSPAGKGLERCQEFSGEDDSFTSARSSPAAAAQAVKRGSPECCEQAAGHEMAMGDQPSKQPSLLPRALSTGHAGQSSGAKIAPAGRQESRDQGSRDQAKQSGSLLHFSRSASKEPESWAESKRSEHLNGAAD